MEIPILFEAHEMRSKYIDISIRTTYVFFIAFCNKYDECCKSNIKQSSIHNVNHYILITI